MRFHHVWIHVDNFCPLVAHVQPLLKGNMLGVNTFIVVVQNLYTCSFFRVVLNHFYCNQATQCWISTWNSHLLMLIFIRFLYAYLLYSTKCLSLNLRLLKFHNQQQPICQFPCSEANLHIKDSEVFHYILYQFILANYNKITFLDNLHHTYDTNLYICSSLHCFLYSAVFGILHCSGLSDDVLRLKDPYKWLL